MCKKIFKTLMLSVTMMIICLAMSMTASAEKIIEGDYTYTVENSEATITEYIGDGGNVVIPSTIGGYPVTSIGDYAFSNCYSLTSIEIPDSVTNIGDGAFKYCNSLTSIEIPDSVTSIGNYAFNGCGNLTSIEIPDSVTSIGDDAFYSCDSLTSIEIPDSVISIGGAAFFDTAYYDDTDNWEDGKLYIGNHLIKVTDDKSGNYAIKSGTRTIADYAFYGCESLTSIEIPDGVTSIGDYAFEDCDSLTSIEIPDSVTTIGKSAFYGCTGITELTIGNGVETIGGSAFSGCGGITELVIPDSVITIGEAAFNGCTGITKLTIGSGVETIGKYAFRNCSGITELVIPDSVTTIGDYAFGGCARLKKVTIGNGTTQILQNTFDGCAELNEIIIPDSVTSIGDYAFNGCGKLKSVFFTGTETEWNSITMGTYNQNLTDLPIHFETTDHTWIVDEAVSATCTETGLTEGKHCSICLLVGTAQDIIPALGHTVVVDNGVEPTCVSMGLTEGKHCSACQAVLTEQRILPATGMHTEESLPAVEATCTQTGLTEGSVCADCGKVIVKQNVIPATGHHSGEGLVLSEATCNSIGITIYKCVDCSVITDMVTVDALSHKMGEWTTVQAPTCTASGEEIRKCENCDHTETNILEKTEHKEEVVPSTPATCTSIGLTEGKVCSDCGAVIVKQDVIPATGHHSDEGTVLSDLTCSHMGIKVFKCLDCGTVIEIETTEKLPHSEVILPAVAATCTYSGLTEGLACDACGETIIAQEETPVLGHSLGEWTVSVKPTCTDSGEIKRCCDACDYTETGKVEATGHDPVTDKGVEATCNSTGLTEGSHCADCGTVFVSQDEIPMTDHEDNDGNGYCDYCDEDVDETDNCSCNCHKTGFIGFIWKIINFFNKLFKTNRVCECGAYHY